MQKIGYSNPSGYVWSPPPFQLVGNRLPASTQKYDSGRITIDQDEYRFGARLQRRDVGLHPDSSWSQLKRYRMLSGTPEYTKVCASIKETAPHGCPPLNEH